MDNLLIGKKIIGMKIAADLACRKPLNQLNQVCETQSRISSESLHEYLDKAGDLMAGIALDIRHAITSVSQPAPVSVVLEKYDDVLIPFVAMMRAELHANANKGDRPGWLQMDSKTAILEVFYHMGKLHQAVHRGDAEAIKEYAADVANMCMMLVDVCGLLPTDEQPAPVSVLPADWQDQLFAEMERRFGLRKQIDDDHLVNDDTQLGVEFARDWIVDRLDKVKELNQ